MGDKIRVRMYNVHFGDAVLVTIPDKDPKTGRTTPRNVLIDVGNVLSGDGGDDAVFKAVIEDILRELGGRPLDLYVMTHEHLDHVQGLYYAATKLYPPGDLRKRLATRYAWLTASAAEDYYQRFPNAQKQKLALQAAWRQVQIHLETLPEAEAKPFGTLLAINNPQSTADCIGFLRALADKKRTCYVHSGFDTKGKHPFKEAKFEVWAPEQDTSRYYKGLLPMAGAPAVGPAATASEATSAMPPPGVDAGSFQDLVNARSRGFADNILAIDKAANNTSVVFTIEWRGHRLLFPGDAELKSWQTMADQGRLKPVDFVKVSHHGSHNGTPAPALMDRYLPKGPGAKKRTAVISTWTDTYSGIPDTDTNDKYTGRAALRSMLDDKTIAYLDTYIG